MAREFDERNMARSRERCAAMAEAANTGKRILTERERRILDMWPRFEDTGEPVMIGDEATNNKNQRFTVKRIEFWRGKWMLNDSVTEGHYLNGKSGERVKRTAPKVLDADGVEIKMGDTVWHHSGFAHGVVTSIDAGSLMGTVCYVNGGMEFRDAAKDLTHTSPDSWERLEEEADKDVVDYWGCAGRSCYACPAMIDGQTPSDRYGCMSCKIAERLDIIRRAKKLAGVSE